MGIVNSALVYTKRGTCQVIGYGPGYDVSYPRFTRDIDGPSGFVGLFSSKPYGVVIVEGSEAEALRIVEEVDRTCRSGTNKPVISVVENGNAGLVARLNAAFAPNGIRIFRATRIGDIVDVGLRN